MLQGDRQFSPGLSRSVTQPDVAEAPERRTERHSALLKAIVDRPDRNRIDGRRSSSIGQYPIEPSSSESSAPGRPMAPATSSHSVPAPSPAGMAA